MYVVAVTVFVKPEFSQQFISATLDNARNTRKEGGNLRFDVLQAEEEKSTGEPPVPRPARFMLYEAYKTKEDFAAHQQTPHYLRWKQAVADWMAQPRQGIRHTSVFFGDNEQ